MDYEKLVCAAIEAKQRAYAPYSGFRVGAAVAARSGRIYTGMNIENASYGATVCAERTAVFKAVSEGEKLIEAVAVVSDSEDYVFPCGICRQVLNEFAADDLKIICCKSNGDSAVYTLSELLPHAFK